MITLILKLKKLFFDASSANTWKGNVWLLYMFSHNMKKVDNIIIYITYIYIYTVLNSTRTAVKCTNFIGKSYLLGWVIAGSEDKITWLGHQNLAMLLQLTLSTLFLKLKTAVPILLTNDTKRQTCVQDFRLQGWMSYCS